MKPILDKTNPWELNALFIQPNAYCARNCKGCYVKEFPMTRGVLASVMAVMFDKFYLNEEVSPGLKAWANQITISLDDLSERSIEADHQKNFLNEIIRTLDYYKNHERDFPEVHLTTHTIRTFKKYYEDLWLSSCWAYAAMFDMFSLSTITEADIPDIKGLKAHIAQKNKRTLINYNHLLPSHITSFSIDKYVDHITMVGNVVDSIYLVMFKRAMGLPENNLTQIGDKSRMMNDIRLINTLQERLPEHIRQKVHIDGCLQDTRNHRRTGFGCSSNVSRLQIWPDGSVSGCAYAIKGHTKGGSTVTDILENIRTARKEYDFRSICRLPKVYDSICK